MTHLGPGWQGVIVHHTTGRDTRGPDLSRHAAYHRAKGWRAIGYHAVVERLEGEVYVVCGRPMTWVGSHARGFNDSHLGLAFVGDFMEVAPPSDQLREGALWIAGVFRLLGVPVEEVPDRVLPHREVGNTDCPGAAFPLGDLRDLVATFLAASEV